MKITLTQLKRHGACEDAIALFERVFGESAEMNKSNVDKFIKARGGKYAMWFAKEFVSKKKYHEYWNDFSARIGAEEFRLMEKYINRKK